MRLFGRKPRDDEVEERCPNCGEPVPEGALECLMCGVDLKPLRGTPREKEVSSPQSDSPAG